MVKPVVAVVQIGTKFDLDLEFETAPPRQKQNPPGEHLPEDLHLNLGPQSCIDKSHSNAINTCNSCLQHLYVRELALVCRPSATSSDQ